MGPNFYALNPLGDGPQLMVGPARVNSSTEEMMIFMANSVSITSQAQPIVANT